MMRLYGYALLTKFLAALPGTKYELSEATGMSPQQCLKVARMMRAAMLVHRSEIRNVGPRGSQLHVFALGTGPEPEAARESRATSNGIIGSLSVIVSALEVGDLTRGDVAEQTGLHTRTVQKVITELRKRGLVHVTSWEPTGHTWTARWTFGGGSDVPKPRRLTRRAMSQRNWARAKGMSLQARVTSALFCSGAPA